MSDLKIGTCSWKYDSWKGLVYPEFGEFNFLEEYGKKFNTVEIDQWFWSLYSKNKITLPAKNVVKEYNDVTPSDFKFTIKAPNSITLTHPHKSSEVNRHFLSSDLMESFLDSIEPIKEKVGVIIFQFEYLNQQKMSSQILFQRQLETFFSNIDRNYNYAIEIRNPNYLNENWFEFLQIHSISNVFMQGYYMPNIYDTYNKFGKYILGSTVIRLHGFDRTGIEEKTRKIWNEIVNPMDEDLKKVTKMIEGLLRKKVDIYLNVNNHYEGSAPLTIMKIAKLLSDKN